MTDVEARPGSGLDLSRRMDAMEKKHEELAKEVASLAGTVARVEQNQVHAAELNKLRFDALDLSIGNVGATLERFMGRINAIVAGEVKMPQAEEGERLVADYQAWRKEVDTDREEQAVLNGQVRLLGKLAVILVTSQVLAIVAALYGLVAK